MTQSTPPKYPEWEPVSAPPTSGSRLFLRIAGAAAGVLALLYALAYLADTDGNDALLSMARIVTALAGAVLLTVAWAVGKQETPRIRSVISLGITMFAAAALDALYILLAGALRLPAITRTLLFLFMGILLGTQLILLLRRGKDDENSVAAFFAKHAPIVAFLLFLIITRVALRDALAGVMPSLFLNLLFLVLFLSTAIYLIGRFVNQFGSPISWGSARRHEQTVERLSDAKMEEVRDLLRQYITTGRKLPEYQEMMRTVMQRVEANPQDVEPLLARAPGPLKPQLREIPSGTLLSASLLLAASLGTIVFGLLLVNNAETGALLIAIITTGALQPIAGSFLRASDADTPPPLNAWIAGMLCLFGAAGLYVRAPSQLLAIAIGGICGVLLIGNGIATLLRKQRATRGPDQAYLRAEATQTQARRARTLFIWAAALAAAVPVWWVFVLASRPWIRLDNPPLVLLWIGPVAGGLCALTAYLVGPRLAAHREELRAIHQQETNLRQSYHRVLVKKLEGART